MRQSQVNSMKNKTATLLPAKDDLFVDLTFHNFPASLIAEFSQKIVTPFYKGNLAVAIQDMMEEAISEETILSSHITQAKASWEAE